jgi:glycopeptide antibiotics resistance protein
VSAPSRRVRPAVRGVARVLAAVYLVGLVLIALWPTPVDRGASGTIAEVLAFLHAHGVPEWLGYPVLEFSANIALFVPVGLLGVVLFGTSRWWQAVLAGLAVSTLIEVSQLLFLPDRFATAQDVLANGLGAALGALLAVAFFRRLEAGSRGLDKLDQRDSRAPHAG